jgi:hypothetical protein
LDAASDTVSASGSYVFLDAPSIFFHPKGPCLRTDE